MGWARCGTDSRGRQIGYAVRATCDEPGCREPIDRGLAHACGGMHGDGDPDYSCEGYFCTSHLYVSELPEERCRRCAREANRETRRRANGRFGRAA